MILAERGTIDELLPCYMQKTNRMRGQKILKDVSTHVRLVRETGSDSFKKNEFRKLSVCIKPTDATTL